jgi:hypothetical protein
MYLSRCSSVSESRSRSERASISPWRCVGRPFFSLKVQVTLTRGSRLLEPHLIKRSHIRNVKQEREWNRRILGTPVDQVALPAQGGSRLCWEGTTTGQVKPKLCSSIVLPHGGLEVGVVLWFVKMLIKLLGHHVHAAILRIHIIQRDPDAQYLG